MAESSQFVCAPLATAELRYFAIPRDDWELLLVRARQLGAQTIAARVPWAWHQPGPGLIDLTGATDPCRDIVGFARLCGQLGLRAILYPGPLHRAELLGGGVPAWLLQHYPHACASDADGQPWLDDGGLPGASALHPDYLAAARRWIAAFTAALLPLQAPRGPITALHIGGPSTRDHADHNEAARAYPGAPPLPPDDSDDFMRWYDATAVAIVAGWLRENGWTVPLDQAPASTAPRHDVFQSAGFASSLFDRDTSSARRILPPDGYNHQLLAAATHHAPGAPTNAGGRIGAQFWPIKIANTFINAAGADFAVARAPADLALVYAGAYDQLDPNGDSLQALAERLANAGIAFDILNLDTATGDLLSRYALVVVPAQIMRSHTAQEKLKGYENLAFLNDEADQQTVRQDEEELATLSPPDLFSLSSNLPAHVSIERLTELIEERGGFARYAWADTAEIDLSIRYGATYIYLLINNRRQSSYNGILAYRATDGAVLHLHIGIGAGRTGMVLLVGDEVHGAAIDGDGSEGGWLTRGLHSSAVFNTGAGVLARCGGGLILAAPQSGRFQTRRIEGWAEMSAHRLLMSGALLPAQIQTDAAHLVVPYVAQDEQGQTDLYLVLPPGELPAPLREYLATLPAGRAASLRRAAALAEQLQARTDAPTPMYERAAEALADAAGRLEAAATQLTSLDAYIAAWCAADERVEQAVATLGHALTRLNGAALAGTLDQASYETLERHITRIIRVSMRLNDYG
jgi:hypothetical protein